MLSCLASLLTIFYQQVSDWRSVCIANAKHSCVPKPDGLTMNYSIEKSRIDWVDYAKGICIILVVMMHSTLGVEKAAGEISWLNGFIEWARPFRMPDFFMISGLFLASRIDKPWRSYLDTKVLHFAYFYVLWMTIQTFTRSWGVLQSEGISSFLKLYLEGFYEPYGTLWFIYLLAIFFVVTKLLHKVPALLIFAAAALLEMALIETGYMVIDEFASRYVYFFAGFWLAKHILDFATAVSSRQLAVIFAGLVIWGFANHAMIQAGLSYLPGISLAMGFVGAAAVVSAGVLLAKTNLARAIRYCGENSIIIYLAFSLFMAPTRVLLLKFAPNLDLGVISVLTTASGVIGPIFLYWITSRAKLSFLFTRPDWAKLAKPKAQWHSADHVKLNTVKSR